MDILLLEYLKKMFYMIEMISTIYTYKNPCKVYIESSINGLYSVYKENDMKNCLVKLVNTKN